MGNSGPRIIGADPTLVEPKAGDGLGVETENNGRTLVYFKAMGTLPAGSLVAIDENGEAAAGYATGVVPSKIGITLAAMVSGEFGWAMLKGSGQVLAINAAALDVAVYTSATPGAVGTSSGSQTKIQNLRLDATNSSGSTGLTNCTAIARLTAN